MAAKKIVEIKENPKKPETAGATTDKGAEQTVQTTEEKVSFFRHPIKWMGQHKVATTVTAAVTTVTLGVGALLLKGLADKNDDDDSDDFEDEDDDDEEEEE